MRAGFLVLLVASTGCGALFASNMRSVQVMSNPPGAQVLLDGNPVGITPGVVTVVNKKSHTVTLRLGGYHDGVCTLESNVKAVWVVLDVLLGLLPVIIDLATGAWNEIDATACNLNLIPHAPPPPPPQSFGVPSS